MNKFLLTVGSITVFLSGCLFQQQLVEDLKTQDDCTQQPANPPATLNMPLMTEASWLDHQNARDFYQWAADSGYPQAMEILGLLLIYSEPSDVEKGLEYLHKAKDRGFVSAEISLAKLYAQGKYVILDLDKALHFLDKAIEQNNIDAIKLGAYYAEQKGDKALCISLLSRAADLGDISAKDALAKHLLNNDDLDINSRQHALDLGVEAQTEGLYEELFDLKDFWPNHSAKDININSLQLAQEELLDEKLSSMIEIPNLPDSYPNDFYSVFSKAASMGSAYASYQKARMMVQSPTIRGANTQELWNLLSSAQDAIPAAKVLKARLIMQRYWKDVDQNSARDLIEQAAKANEPYALLVNSLFLRQDGLYDRSIADYKKALELKDIQWHQYLAASDLLKGNLPFFDNQIAFDWMTELASKNFNLAMLKLAELKEKKMVACSDPQEIFLLRIKSAWQGSPLGQYLVGNMYLNGDAVMQNQTKAFRWFNSAARCGYKPAQYQVAIMYEKGIGVLPNLAKAYAWYSIASRNLIEDDKEFKAKLALAMNQEQLSEALHFEKIFRQYYDRQSYNYG